MSESQEKKGMPISTIVHTLIGLAIMFFGRHIPPFEIIAEPTEKLLAMNFPAVDGGILVSVTPTGMLVLSIFLGLIYLWTFVDTLWPTFLAVFALGASSYAPMPQVLGGFLGNPQVVNVFFLFLFAAAIVRSQVSIYLARAILTQKVLAGRPWLLSGALLFACYFVSFLDQVSFVFIILPVMYLLFNEVGLKKGDKYVSLMIINGVFMIILSFASDAIKNGAFILLTALYSIGATSPELNIVPISTASYLVFSITVSVIIMLILLALMRFVFRVDVEPIRKFDINVFAKKQLPPMNWKQKTLLSLFILLIFWMVTPSIIGTNNALGHFLSTNALASTLFLTFAITIIQFKGEPLTEIGAVMGTFPWRVFFLVAAAFLLGGAVTAPATNIAIMLETVLRSIFSGMDFVQLCVVAVAIAMFVTNFFNSVVAGIIFCPLLAALCVAYNYGSSPLLACFIYTVLVGAITPAASPFAAILHGNQEWLETGDIVKYTTVASAVTVLVVSLVGVPLAMLLF